MERCPYVNDELLKVIAVEPPYVVVEGAHGARYRARYIRSHESERAEPLQPEDILTVTGPPTPQQAVVERMTQVNRGRAFFTSPEKLGSFLMVDYLRGRRKRSS